jgi:Fur family transcriptional regulator, ferric uptake regulator
MLQIRSSPILRAVAANGSPTTDDWSGIRDHLRKRGLRWTPQRRLILDVLQITEGHVTGAELVERCRALDPETTPSTVYRTLRVLEELGIVRHAHGSDGREEFHVRPAGEHGHLHCETCGSSWEISVEEAASTVLAFEQRRGFAVDLSHLTVVGQCAACQAIHAQ